MVWTGPSFSESFSLGHWGATDSSGGFFQLLKNKQVILICLRLKQCRREWDRGARPGGVGNKTRNSLRALLRALNRWTQRIVIAWRGIVVVVDPN